MHVCVYFVCRVYVSVFWSGFIMMANLLHSTWSGTQQVGRAHNKQRRASTRYAAKHYNPLSPNIKLTVRMGGAMEGTGPGMEITGGAGGGI